MLPRPRRSRRRAARMRAVWKRGTVPAINRRTRGPLMEAALEQRRARPLRTTTPPTSTTAAVPWAVSVTTRKVQGYSTCRARPLPFPPCCCCLSSTRSFLLRVPIGYFDLPSLEFRVRSARSALCEHRCCRCGRFGTASTSASIRAAHACAFTALQCNQPTRLLGLDGV